MCVTAAHTWLNILFDPMLTCVWLSLCWGGAVFDPPSETLCHQVQVSRSALAWGFMVLYAAAVTRYIITSKRAAADELEDAKRDGRHKWREYCAQLHESNRLEKQFGGEKQSLQKKIDEAAAHVRCLEVCFPAHHSCLAYCHSCCHQDEAYC